MKISRIVCILLALLVLLTAAAPAFATETETTAATEPAYQGPSTSGTCGEGIYWELMGTTLVITGSGAMADGSPWRGNEDKIETLILSGGITYVGAGAFSGYKKLSAIDFGNALVEIGDEAFRGCTELTAISLPATFRKFGSNSFRECTGLQEVHCAGPMPRFNDSCLSTGNHILVYFPGNSPWPQAEVDRLMHNFGGYLEVIPATSEAPAPTAPTAPREAAPPETTVPETTAPVTEPTVPPTTAPQPTQPQETVPVVTTEPETLPPETTAAATVPQETTEPVVYTLPVMATEPAETEEAEEGLNGIVIGIVLVGGVLTFFLVGALVARSLSKKGGRYYD